MLNKQFISYAVVGGMGTVAHYCVLFILHEWLAIAVLAATTAGAVVGAIVNYLLNYFFTFKSEQKHLATASRFFSIALLGLLLNYVTMATLNAIAPWHYFISQLIATLLVLILGYACNKYWTFSQG